MPQPHVTPVGAGGGFLRCRMGPVPVPVAGAAGRRGFGRPTRVGRLVASGGGLDEKCPVVDELIFDTTYFELSRDHEFLGLDLALCIMRIALFKVVHRSGS